MNDMNRVGFLCYFVMFCIDEHGFVFFSKMCSKNKKKMFVYIRQVQKVKFYDA